MNFQLSRAEINWRLALYVVLSVNGFVLADQWFTSTVPQWVRLMLGALNAGLLVIRAFIDKSPAQGEQTPVTVTAKEPLPVTETAPTEPKESIE